MRFPSTEVEYVLAVILILLMILTFVFRKWISYLYCPLEHYEGKYLGKSGYTFFVHIFLSVFATISLFILASNSFDLIDYFERLPRVRIFTFISLFLIVFLSIGFIIDKYLMATDKVYNEWKDNQD
jgi:hypothetical protein